MNILHENGRTASEIALIEITLVGTVEYGLSWNISKTQKYTAPGLLSSIGESAWCTD